MPTVSRSVVLLGLFLSSLAWAEPAQAQQCPASSLTYVVRDASGKLFYEAFKSVAFTGSAQGRAWWAWTPLSESYSFFGFAPVMPAELQAAAKRDLQSATGANTLMTSSSGCSFQTGATLNLTMAGKTMRLVFNASLKCCNVDFFLVDGLPFQEGRFEITLTRTDQEQHVFIPAKNWTKISD